MDDDLLFEVVMATVVLDPTALFEIADKLAEDEPEDKPEDKK